MKNPNKIKRIKGSHIPVRSLSAPYEVCRFHALKPVTNPFCIVEKKEIKRTSSKKKDDENFSYIAYRFSANPDKEQAHLLSMFAGCCRFLWNYYVAEYKDGRELKTPAACKKNEGMEFLAECDSLALANVQINFEAAKSDYENGKKGRPKFKKKSEHKDSYKTNVTNDNIKFDPENMTVTLPKIKAPIKVTCHRGVKKNGVLKSVTVIKEPSGKWFFSFLFEYPKEEFEATDNIERFLSTGDDSFIKHLGLDMSLPKLFVSSDGTLPEYFLNEVPVKFTKQYRKIEKRIAKEQRKLSNMVKNSNNYNKQCQRIATLHAKAKHARQDFLTQLAVRLARKYDIISIEDLDMSAMKKALSFGKSVSDNGWGFFTQVLARKCEENGHLLVKINKWFPSSKTCCICGHIHKELKLNDRTYACPKCGSAMDRDEQAAINIDREGLKTLLQPEEVQHKKEKGAPVINWKDRTKFSWLSQEEEKKKPKKRVSKKANKSKKTKKAA